MHISTQGQTFFTETENGKKFTTVESLNSNGLFPYCDFLTFLNCFLLAFIDKHVTRKRKPCLILPGNEVSYNINVRG